MEKMSITQLLKNGTISNISELRINENGLPFVTMITRDSKSQNVYFSIETGNVVLGTFSKGQHILEFLADAEVIKTENAQGEVRYKIFKVFNSKYSSNADLERIFGIEIPGSSFDLQDFKQGFKSRNELVKTSASLAV